MNGTYHIPSEYEIPIVPTFPSIIHKKHAEICPVCKGSGKYTETKVISTGVGSNYYYQRTCHGCGGLGWVIITDECDFTNIKWTCK